VTFTPLASPLRIALVGFGPIYDLNVLAHRDNPDVEVMALVDPDGRRREQRQADWRDAAAFAAVGELAKSDLEVDAVEAMLPVALHAEGVVELLGYGWHVNLHKPLSCPVQRAGGSERPPAAGHGDLPLLRAAPAAEGGDRGDPVTT
jgi:predicted dehydrogenase